MTPTAIPIRGVLWLLMMTFGSAPTPRESTEVMRAQLELSVCDVRGAGSDDAVSVSLGGRTRTWLDQPGRDLERGGRYRYDLLLEDVHVLGDIGGLAIEKSGTDDLCLAELQLLVNGTPIFRRTFTGGLWLGADAGLATSRAELRANAAWQGWSWSMSEWVASSGGAISRRELVERLESSIASAMHDSGLAWNARAAPAIDVRQKDESTVRVRAALVSEVPYWLNEDVTLELELSVCEARVSRVLLAPVRKWYTFARAGDERMLMAVRDRLARAKPIVIAGVVCPRVDPSGNLIY
jgi:hypothetical protein